MQQAPVQSTTRKSLSTTERTRLHASRTVSSACQPSGPLPRMRPRTLSKAIHAHHLDVRRALLSPQPSLHDPARLRAQFAIPYPTINDRKTRGCSIRTTRSPRQTGHVYPVDLVKSRSPARWPWPSRGAWLLRLVSRSVQVSVRVALLGVSLPERPKGCRPSGSNVMTSMSSRVRRARTLVAISQAELARRLGVDRSSVTQWEQPQGTRPSVDHLAQIAIETGVCFEWLATGRGPSQPEDGRYETALVVEDYARDAMESRALTALRRLSTRRRAVAVQIIELLSNKGSPGD